MTGNHMKKSTLALLAATCLTVAGLTCLSCGKQASSSQDTDNQYTRDNIRAIAMINPDKAMSMLDTAEQRNLMSKQEIYGMKGVLYNNFYQKLTLSLQYMRKAYDCPESKTDTALLLKILIPLGLLNSQLGQYADAMKYMKEGMELARKNGDVEAEANFTMNMGLVKKEFGTMEEALQEFDNCIALFKQTGKAETSMYVADNILMSNLYKMNILIDKNEYRRAGEALPEYREAFEKIKDCGLPESHVDARLAELSALEGTVYYNLGDKERAEKCFNVLQSTEYAKSLAGGTLMIQTYMTLGKYREVLDYAKKQEAHYVSARDTMSENFVETVLEPLLQAYDKLGMYREASAVAQRFSALTDSLRRKEREEKVTELMTAYETEVKEAMLRENALKMSQMRLFIYAAVLVCLLLLALIVLVLSYNKRIRRRNLATVKTIEELMEQKDELLDLQVNKAEEQKEAGQKARNLKEYLTDMHMRNAVKMLKSKEAHTMAGIAQQCGFATEDEFCHVFEKKYGISPLEYRKWVHKLRVKDQQGVDNEEFKRTLLQNISHEIRTPLNQISGYVQLLTDPELNIGQSEKEQFSEIITSQANHMTHMVNDFVEITEYESDKSPLAAEDIALEDLLTRMSCSAGEPPQGVTLKLGQLASPQRIVHLPVKATVRMAQCLLDNAFKFTTEGQVTMDLSVDESQGMLRLTVSDTGKGIKPENAERIFERFFKEDNFVPGVGLGLSLTRIIATRLGGTVHLDTAFLGPGSRFILTIPL